MTSLRPSFLFLLACLAGCSSSNEPVKVDPATAKPANPPGASAPPQAPKLPANHPPIEKPPPKNMGAIAFKAQEGWTSEPATQMFRREQYRLAHQGQDADDALVLVSFLGPTAGTLEANKLRWAGQFSQPDGKPSTEVAKVNERALGSIKVVDFEIAGTMLADSMGGDPKTEKPGWRMLVAWLQASDGNYFVKLIGPQATVAHWEPSFRKFVDSAQ